MIPVKTAIYMQRVVLLRKEPEVGYTVAVPTPSRACFTFGEMSMRQKRWHGKTVEDTPPEQGCSDEALSSKPAYELPSLTPGKAIDDPRTVQPEEAFR
jgi:hypothetical protein